MNNLCRRVLRALQGKTLVTAESCTGGGIGAALTAIPGSSTVYKGGVICYTNWVKENILDVDREVLDRYGAVSLPVAGYMADGVRELLKADIAVSVTGLAGPDGDEFGHEVGTVYIGYSSAPNAVTKKFLFSGNRESIRNQAIVAALEMIIEYNT